MGKERRRKGCEVAGLVLNPSNLGEKSRRRVSYEKNCPRSPIILTPVKKTIVARSQLCRHQDERGKGEPFGEEG